MRVIRNKPMAIFTKDLPMAAYVNKSTFKEKLNSTMLTCCALGMWAYCAYLFMELPLNQIFLV